MAVSDATRSVAPCALCGSAAIARVDGLAAARVVSGYAAAYAVAVAGYFAEASARLELLECQDCGLRSYTPAVAGDPGFYEALQRLPWYYQDLKPEYAFAKDHVGETARVLEVGCGKGAFRAFLAPGVSYRGLEFNDAAIAKAASSGLDVVAETIEAHAAANREVYDVVCHFQVLEHVAEPRRFLSACAAALAPGGKLIVAVPAEDSFLSIAEGGWLNMPPHHLTRWKDATLKRAFAEMGFSRIVLWHETVADYHHQWYRSILSTYGVKRLFGRRPELDGKGILSRVARRIAACRRLQDHLVDYAETHFEFARRGHTVCVVGVKPAPPEVP